MTPSDAPIGSAASPRVSLGDVAREAGVSVATASRAVSGRAVRPALRERVENAVIRLGYRPDLAAQAVARGTTNTVALIVDYLRSPFGVEITRGVVDSASRHGLVVNVIGSETHPGDLLEMIATARALRPRSIVLATGRVQDALIRNELIRTLTAYQSSGGSVAIIDGLDLPFASCAFDETAASYALAETLVDLGYERPLVFNGSSERSDLTGRTNALIEGFERAGLSRDHVCVTEVPTTESSTADDSTLLDLGDADVVLCVEGAVLPAVYRHIRSLGRRVGTDVAVTAFGQYPIADALRPHLTTVMIPLRQAGELALEHALTDTSGAHLSLPCNLRIRASTPERLGRSSGVRDLRPDLASGGLRMVGIVVPPLPPADLGAISAEFLQLARADSRQCILMDDSLLDEADPALLALCDALVVWGRPSAQLARRVSESGVRCVTVDLPSTLDMAQLSIEVAEGFQALLEHLYALGHMNIAYLAGADSDPSERQRRWGIDLFTATHDDVSIRIVPLGQGDSLDSVLAHALDEGVTAVLTHREVLGVRVIRQLRTAGCDVPGDVSVAGFSGGSSFEQSVELTTVRLDLAAAARSAWRLLWSSTAAGETRSLRVPVKLEGSTARARQPASTGPSRAVSR